MVIAGNGQVEYGQVQDPEDEATYADASDVSSPFNGDSQRAADNVRGTDDSDKSAGLCPLPGIPGSLQYDRCCLGLDCLPFQQVPRHSLLAFHCSLAILGRHLSYLQAGGVQIATLENNIRPGNAHIIFIKYS